MAIDVRCDREGRMPQVAREPGRSFSVEACDSGADVHVEMRGIRPRGNETVKGRIWVAPSGVAVGDTKAARNWIETLKVGYVADEGEQVGLFSKEDGEDFGERGNSAEARAQRAVVIRHLRRSQRRERETRRLTRAPRRGGERRGGQRSFGARA